MILTGVQEIWVILLYCILSWVAFTLALYLADNVKRKKEAMVGGVLILVLASVLSMLSGFAANQLQTGMVMNMVFQLSGIFVSTMAVSRVLQVLSWPRTWLAAILVLAFYLTACILMGWGVVLAA